MRSVVVNVQFFQVKEVVKKLDMECFSTRMGFEPTRAEHIGLAVQRLNHSATSSLGLVSLKLHNLFVNVA